MVDSNPHKHRHRHRHRHRRNSSDNSNESSTTLLSKHKRLMQEYAAMKRKQNSQYNGGPITDNDVIARNYQFIMDSDVSKAKNWEQRLAIRYYNRLYKEYALVDLTYYEINRIGMRWRTEKEVIEGKGQFSCANLNCDNSNIRDLCSYEVPFKYKDLEGNPVSTLVKVRLCGPCALKLFNRKIHQVEREHPELRDRRKQCETSKDVFDYITSILKVDDVQSPPPEPPLVSAKQNPVERSPVVQNSEKREKPIKKKQKKPKVNGHVHYSSSSESSSAEEVETLPQAEEKELDADGNEVISTSNDVWKTSVEVEHTENENMDDFINQLFLLFVCGIILM